LFNFFSTLAYQNDIVDKSQIVQPYPVYINSIFFPIKFPENPLLSGSFFKKKEIKKWTWISLNREVKNEIDHLLINDMSLVKDVKVLQKFEFASDHRMCRCTLKIPKRIKYKTYLKSNKTGSVMVPLSKIHEARDYLKEKLVEKGLGDSGKLQVQEMYNAMIDVVKETMNLFGSKKKYVSTDDKLSKNTKILIEKREQMKMKKKLTPIQKIELTEVCKMVRREIRKDCQTYEENKVCEIIEESWSTRKLRTELSHGKNMISELLDNEGKTITGRDKIIEEATRFYKELYKTKRENINDDELGKVGGERDDDEPFKPILKS